MKLFFIFMIQMLTKGEEENLKQMKNIYNRTFAFFFYYVTISTYPVSRKYYIYNAVATLKVKYDNLSQRGPNKYLGTQKNYNLFVFLDFFVLMCSTYKFF